MPVYRMAWNAWTCGQTQQTNLFSYPCISFRELCFPRGWKRLQFSAITKLQEWFQRKIPGSSLKSDEHMTTFQRLPSSFQHSRPPSTSGLILGHIGLDLSTKTFLIGSLCHEGANTNRSDVGGEWKLSNGEIHRQRPMGWAIQKAKVKVDTICWTRETSRNVGWDTNNEGKDDCSDRASEKQKQGGRHVTWKCLCQRFSP